MTEHVIDLQILVTNEQAEAIITSLINPTTARIAIGEWEADCPVQLYPHMPGEEDEPTRWQIVATAIQEP